MTISTNSRYFFGNGRPIGTKPAGDVAEPVNTGRGHTTAQPLCSDSRCPVSPSGFHHYMLDGQDGPMSVGECRYCGYQREFRNYWADADSDYRGAKR